MSLGVTVPGGGPHFAFAPMVGRSAQAKQKLLAAHRAGITTVLIPERNEPDLDDVPEEVLGQLTVHAVSDVRRVLELALEPARPSSAGAAGADTRDGGASRSVRV